MKLFIIHERHRFGSHILIHNNNNNNLNAKQGHGYFDNGSCSMLFIIILCPCQIYKNLSYEQWSVIIINGHHPSFCEVIVANLVLMLYHNI
ncbi:hypothetical protein DERP_007564 [Dermatophagoides pteronyssinus]|uniref:Uncharacterized protein n=1 Tax=Dermatophagoides pteronyssinus TaxID=6956 RepID=A0ABQ8JKK8_DERPT|nr:hypothetical protein DERP_007564 [Dermatophagoides pteronyssinus]